MRYDEPRPFTIVGNKLARLCSPTITGETVMMELLDAVIDRAADILERIGADVDQVSHDIFEPEDLPVRARSYNDILKTIGRKGDLTSKVRESLVSIGRLLLYLANEADSMRWAKEPKAQLKGMQRDVQSLSDHATYLSSKIQFLLDAMLGVVSLEQNNIIKIFSVMAVVLMPPTLDRVDLRHEFQGHAGARMELRLSVGDRADADRRGAALSVLQVEEVVVKRLEPGRRAGLTRAGRR